MKASKLASRIRGHKGKLYAPIDMGRKQVVFVPVEKQGTAESFDAMPGDPELSLGLVEINGSYFLMTK